MKTKFFWGVILLLGAVALILYGLGVPKEIAGLSAWQIIGGFACVYWIFSTIVFHKSARRKLQIAFPIAFLFIIFEKNIARAVGSDNDNLIANWIVILAAVLVSASIEMLIPNGKRYSKEYTVVGNGTSNSNMFSGKSLYLDAAVNKHEVKNKFGELQVFFQNVDSANVGTTVEVCVDNDFGETTVNIPDGWGYKLEVSSTFGDVKGKRDRNESALNQVRIFGTNNFGEVNVK